MPNNFSETKFDRMIEEDHYRESFTFLTAYDESVEDPYETNDEIVAREIQTYNDGIDWFDAMMKRQAEDAEAAKAHCEFHRPITRGKRRYQTQKIKEKYRAVLTSSRANDFLQLISKATVGKIASVHGAKCSCHMCGNPRKWYKGRNKITRTRKELDAIKTAKEGNNM